MKKTLEQKGIHILIASCLVLLTGFIMPYKSYAKENIGEIAGYIENITINSIPLRAKLDTGADNCSLHAHVLQSYEKDGKTWVDFELVNDDNEHIPLTAEQVRISRIKMRTGGYQERPVVKLTVNIGSLSKEVEINLADRKGFEYRVLLGRNFLKHGILVNSAKKYILSK